MNIVAAQYLNYARRVLILQFIATRSQRRRGRLEQARPQVSRLPPQIKQFLAQQPLDAILHAINAVDVFILHSPLNGSDQAGVDNGGRAARLSDDEVVM